MGKRRGKQKGRREPKRFTLKDMPFSRLIEEDEYLVQLRRAYADAKSRDRKLAALWEYESGFAAQIFGNAMAMTGDDEALQMAKASTYAPGAVLALAIDPRCAPAMLTIGSVEYQLGRIEEAMDLFLRLASLPRRTKELAEIIDEAGDFLLDQEDYESAEALYAAAARKHRNVALYHGGLSYCEAKLGNKDEAVAHARRAVELEPEHHIHLSNLGWSLMEAGLLDEAEQVLEKAVALSPPDDHLAKNNLADLRSQRRKARGKTGRRKSP